MFIGCCIVQRAVDGVMKCAKDSIIRSTLFLFRVVMSIPRYSVLVFGKQRDYTIIFIFHQRVLNSQSCVVSFGCFPSYFI